MRLTESRRFGLLLALLITGGALIHIWESVGEARVPRHALSEMSQQLGSWKKEGEDQRLDRETENKLRADDYLSRKYVMPDGRAAFLYIGYYATQRTGATYHSPLNCLPGSGWEMRDPMSITITPADGSPGFQANRYIIQNGDDRELLIYWYQGRGRKVASEYWGKIYTVVDSIRLRRSDGAMVRVMTPLGSSVDEALKAATDLAAQVVRELPKYVPD